MTFFFAFQFIGGGGARPLGPPPGHAPADIVGKMDLNENANPNKYFEIFIDNFTKLKQQCMPRKRVRYDKKLHKDNP